MLFMIAVRYDLGSDEQLPTTSANVNEFFLALLASASAAQAVRSGFGL